MPVGVLIQQVMWRVAARRYSPSGSGHASIHIQDLPGDVSCLLGGKKGGCLGYITWGAGVTDRNALARVALKWVLAHEAVTLVVVGADDAAQLANSVSVLDAPDMDDDERAILTALRETDGYRDYAARKRAQFGY